MLSNSFYILFIQNAKCCAVLGIWIEQCYSCCRYLGFKRPDLRIWKNVVIDILQCTIFGFNLRERGTFTSRLAYLVHTTSDNDALQLSFLSNIHDIP
jgi:hypothetical protein